MYDAIRTHQQNPDVICVVYTGDIDPLEDGLTKELVIAKAKERFGIVLRPEALAFLPIKNRYLLDGKYWSHFTLLGQAFGANRVAYEALSQLVPDVFIDTMGYAFTLPAIKNYSTKIRVGTYIHYPIVSTDMLHRVRSRQAGITNSAWIAASLPFSILKLVYYRIFAVFYGSALRSADAIAVNGTWTHNHIESLIQTRMPRPWKVELPPVNIVYPPCDTNRFAKLTLGKRPARSIVSLAQFRPEKDHKMQLRIVHKLLSQYPELKSSKGGNRPLKLVLIGGVRNADDEKRVLELKKLAKELTIESNVEFCVDAPLETILDKFSKASIGISTMVDEHFGINVVEYMAAGLLTLSHASAGPLLDIAVNVDGELTGFHAKTLLEYVDQLHKLVTMPEAEAVQIRSRARTHVQNTFSDQSFQEAWRVKLWDLLVPPSLLKINQELLEEKKAQVVAATQQAEQKAAVRAKTADENASASDAKAVESLVTDSATE